MYCFKNGKDCPYRNTCDAFKKDGTCSAMCVKFHEIDLLFSNANIPRKYLQPIKLFPAQEDVDSYEILNEIKNNILQMVVYGFNMYLVSKLKLNGKTSWGIKILQNYFHYIWQEPGSRKRGLYVDVNEYLSLLKANFDNPDQDIKEFERDLDEVDLVIWDNIDEARLSEWERGNIKQHIKKRLANNLSNIFIGNSLDKDLILKIGEDLKCYIQDNSTLIKLVGKRGDL